MRRLTKRFIIETLENLELSSPIRYERYYISSTLRVQKKDNIYQKEILDNQNNLLEKKEISEKEFLELKKDSYSQIIRDSYLYLNDDRISIKRYLGKYSGLYKAEVSFASLDEEKNYKKESWMGKDITASPLAFDKDLSKLTNEEFRKQLTKYLN